MRITAITVGIVAMMVITVHVSLAAERQSMKQPDQVVATPAATATPTPTPAPAPVYGQVDLTPYFNRSRNSAELNGSSVTVNGSTYQFGSATNNAIETDGQTLALRGKYSAIGLLACGTKDDGYNLTSGKFRINYADGTFSESRVSFPKWDVSPPAWENVAKHVTGGRIGLYYLYPIPGKVVVSVKLCHNNSVYIFAMNTFRGASVDLVKDCNRDGFSLDGARSNGNLDGSGNTYAGDFFGIGGGSTYFGWHSLVHSNMSFNIRAADGGWKSDDIANVVDCKGQYLVMPQGKYNSIHIAGAATGGDKSGTFTLYYSDGASTTADVTMKNWVTGNTSGETILKSLTHYHSAAADVNAINYIFLYAISPTPNKVVTKLGLPNNASMHIVAVSCTHADESEVPVPTPNPRVVRTTYATEDVPVVMYSVTEFGAVANDSNDDTVAFQMALDAARAQGGGVVFAPAGEYVFRGQVDIPANVTLRGDWRNPDAGTLTSQTILKAFASKNDENGAPFIAMHDASTLREINVWYPEQTGVSTVCPYPWTISSALDCTYGPNIKNVTLVNAYKGINATFASCSVFKNVYATVLKKGILYDHIGDVPRTQTVSFRPKYWANSGLGAPPAESAIATYTRSNAEGVILLRNDSPFLYDLYLESFKTAMIFDGGNFGAFYGSIMNVTITDSETGMDFKYISTITSLHVMVSNSRISTVGASGVSVKVRSSVSSGSTITFNSCSIASPDGVRVQNSSGAKVAFAQCPNMTNTSSTSYSNEQAPGNPTLPSYRKPGNTRLYNVMSYGAVGNGTTDDTTSFQNALDAASNAGGGTVYVPAGYYKIAGGLSIASKVELRGVSEGMHHWGTSPRGSVLYVYSTSSRVITLAANAGVRGLSIYYPNQSISRVVAYPDAILFNGTGGYAFDVTTPNAYVAMHVKNGNYYIDGCRGLGLSKYVYMDQVSAAGYVMNCQNTMGDWQDVMREDGNSLPHTSWTSPVQGTSFDVNASSNIMALGFFSFDIGVGTYLHGACSDNTFYNHGHDYSNGGSLVLAGSGTNNRFVYLQMAGFGGNVRVQSGYSGTTKIFSSAVWSSGVTTGDGTVVLQQVYVGSGCCDN